MVHHQARKFGKSKFGINRFFNGYLDLLTLWFLTNFGKKPMHFFGFLGSIMFFISFVALIVMGVGKIIDLSNHVYGPVASSRMARILVLITSRLVRHWSSSRSPMMLRRVVALRFSMATMGCSMP